MTLLKAKYNFPLLSGLTILLLSFLFIPKIPHYQITLNNQVVTPEGTIFTYDDLDFDGISERIEFIFNQYNYCLVMIRQGNIIQGQWKFHGSFALANYYCFYDLDHNGYKELCLFTMRNDSLFLSIIESFTTKTLVGERYIRSMHIINNVANIAIYTPPNSYDFNNDGTDELFFVTYGGYNYGNRQLFCYYLNNDSLIHSKHKGTAIMPPFQFLQHDTSIFITGMGYNSGNMPNHLKYQDSSAWVMAFDKHLNFIFPPVVLGEYPSTTFTKPILINKEIKFVSFYNYLGQNDTSKIFIFDINGNIVKKKNLTSFFAQSAILLDNASEPITLMGSNGITIFDENTLETKKNKSCIDVNSANYFKQDLSGDKIIDNISYVTKFDRFCFTDPVTLEQVILPITWNKTAFSLSKWTDNKNTFIYFHEMGNAYIMEFKTNLLYRIRYLLPLFLFIIIGLVWISIQQALRYYGNKRVAVHNEIARLQLLHVKNQLDSHLTFNMIDCIGNSFRKNDYETADKLITRYARLLQQSVQQGSEIMIPLGQEFEYIENYLILEQARLKQKFQFNMNATSDLSLKIPKYLVFNFVENAVKHGIAPTNTENGFIEIKSFVEKKKTQITIQDNGVGFSAKKIKSNGTGNGLKIIDQLIKLIKTEHKQDIKYAISTVQNKGTTIQITIAHGN